MFRIHERPAREERRRYYTSVISARDPETFRGLRVQLTGNDWMKLRERVENMIRNGTLPPPRYRITFAQYGAIILRRNKEGRADRKQALRDLEELFGSDDVIQSNTPERVKEMIRELDQSALSAARKRSVWNLVCQIGSDCRDRCQLIRINCYKTRRLPRTSRKKIETLEEEEVGIFLKDAKNGDTVDQALAVAICGGPRTAELLAMTVEDLREEGRKAWIHRQIREEGTGKKRKCTAVEWTKTAKRREIDLTSVGADIAKRRMEETDMEEHVDSVIPGEHLLFPDGQGRPLSRKALTERLRAKLKGRTHEDCNLGILRRTSLTIYYHQTGSRVGVQQQSGDSFTALCKYYLAVEKKEIRQMMDRWSETISNMIQGGAMHGNGEAVRVGGILAGGFA